VILDHAAVRTALERCIKDGGFSPGDVHLGIAGLRAITRELEMPLVPDSEIDSAVRLQALDVIPFAIDKALISARPLEETVGSGGMPERRVLVAAAHRDLVDPLVEIVTAAGLTPVSIEPTSSAMIRALFDPETAIAGPEAIVAVGGGLTKVAVHETWTDLYPTFMLRSVLHETHPCR
jgi:type IV pilus assembly protein PilM